MPKAVETLKRAFLSDKGSRLLNIGARLTPSYRRDGSKASFNLGRQPAALSRVPLFVGSRSMSLREG